MEFIGMFSDVLNDFKMVMELKNMEPLQLLSEAIELAKPTLEFLGIKEF